MAGGLRRAARHRGRGIAVKAVFDHIQIESAQVVNTKPVKAVIDRVELERIVSVPELLQKKLKFHKNIFVYFFKIAVADGVFFGIKSAYIAEQKPAGIPDLSESFIYLFEDVF